MNRFTIAADGTIRERPQTPAQQWEFLIYYARVLMREARARRGDARFARFLRDGAARARREAAAIDTRPAQGEMFGWLKLINQTGNRQRLHILHGSARIQRSQTR